MADPRYSDAGYGSVTGHGVNTYTPFVPDRRNDPVAVAGAYNNDGAQVPTPAQGNSHYSPKQLETIKLITEEATKAGKDPAIFIAMAKKESDLGANVGAANSSYRGVMQLGAGAAKDAGLNWAQVDDPRANIAAAIRYADINSKRTGIPVTLDNAGAIYVAHQQGAGGAKAIYKGDPNASIYTALKKEHADANGMSGMTIGQAKAKWDAGTQAFANQWAGISGQAEQANMANALGMGGANLPNPQSQLAAVQGYNTNMVNAAKHIADNNLASVNNFGWNPTVKDSTAQRFGKAVQDNTNGLTAINNQNTESMKAWRAPTATTGLGRAVDRLKAMWDITGTSLQSDYYNGVQAEQSNTGKAMTDQVNNMKSAMADTSINPAVYDKAAGNLTSQQQAENGSYNAVANNYNTQTQLANVLATANMQNETERAKVAVAQQKVTNAGSNVDDNALVNAARSLGITLPQGMNTGDIRATLGDKLAAVQAVAANNGSLGSDPYTAVQTVNMLGNAAPPELIKQSYIHSNFQNEIINSIPKAQFKPDDPSLDKNTLAANMAYNDNIKRIAVNKAYMAASTGTGGYGNTPSNPYSAIGGDSKTLANGLPVPKGILPEEVGKLPATDFIVKATDAGATSVEISNFYKGLATNATKGTNFAVFNAPAPTGKFLVQLKGAEAKMDLATPAGVERFKALLKSDSLRLQPTSTFGKLLSAANDYVSPAGIQGGKTIWGFANHNNAVDNLLGKPQVTYNPK